MRKLFTALVVILALGVAALVLAPGLIPASAYKPQIESAASSALGRQVTMAGDIRFSFFPRLEVLVQDVTVANADWAKADNLAAISELGLGLELMPLLSGELVLQEFTLTDPVINLETDAGGSTNWAFENAEATPSSGSPENPQGTGSQVSAVQDIRLGDVQLINGRITQTTPAGTDVYDNINLVVGLESLDRPMSVGGSLAYQGTPITLSLDLANPRTITDGGTSDVDVTLRSDLIRAAFAGTVENQTADVNLLGDVDLDVPSIAKFMNVFAGSSEGVEHLEALSLSGKMDANGSRANFQSLVIGLEDMTGRGDLAVQYDSAKPYAQGTLKFDTLDFNKLIGLTGAGDANGADVSGSSGQPTTGTQGGGGQAKSADEEWSTEPIDFSALRAFNADLNLSADKLFFQDLKFSQSDLALRARDGLITADLKKVDLYEGSGSGVLKVDARKNNAVIESKFTLNNLLTLPFLADAVGLDRLEGLGSFSYDVTTRGRNEKQLVRNLSGSSRLNVVDGAWKGVNLAEMSRTVQGFLNKNEDDEEAGQESVGNNEKTDFSELGATFDISKGIVQNRDFSMLSPFVRVSGDGNVNLLNQTVDFRLRPKFVDSAAGQGGDLNLSGVTVPIIVEGPISNIRYRADLGSALQEALVPGSAGQSTEDVLKGLIGDLISGDKEEEAAKDSGQDAQKKKRKKKKRQGTNTNTPVQEAPKEAEEEELKPEDLLKDLLGIE